MDSQNTDIIDTHYVIAFHYDVSIKALETLRSTANYDVVMKSNGKMCDIRSMLCKKGFEWLCPGNLKMDFASKLSMHLQWTSYITKPRGPLVQIRYSHISLHTFDAKSRFKVYT